MLGGLGDGEEVLTSAPLQSSFKERQKGMESRQRSVEAKVAKSRVEAEPAGLSGYGEGEEEEEEEGLLGGLIQLERELDIRAVALNVGLLAALLAAGVWTFQNAPLKNSNVLLAAAMAFGVIMCKKRKERDVEAGGDEGRKGSWFYPSIAIVGGTMVAGRLVGAFLARLFAGLPQCDMIVALTPIVGGFLGATFLR